MSCRPQEESLQNPWTPVPITSTKPQLNTGASQDNQDAEKLECQYYSYKPHHKKTKMQVATMKLELHLIVYVPIK